MSGSPTSVGGRYSPLRQLSPPADVPRSEFLLCLPHAGGSAHYFRRWAALHLDIEMVAVQYPGRADRLDEPCATDLRELAAEIAKACSSLWDAGTPVTVFGHSMGAVVGAELICAAERAGHHPARLVVSSARAPHDPDKVIDGVLRWDDDEVVAFLVSMGQPDAELFADPRVRKLILPYLRADFEMLQRYRPTPDLRIAAALVAVSGASDPDVTPVQAARWKELTDDRFTAHVVPGGHFYLDPDPPMDLYLPGRTSAGRTSQASA